MDKSPAEHNALRGFCCLCKTISNARHGADMLVSFRVLNPLRRSRASSPEGGA